MTVSALWLFVMVPWVGLQCVIVVFPDHDHTHLLFLAILSGKRTFKFIHKQFNLKYINFT